jgi:hypothetical protein
MRAALPAQDEIDRDERAAAVMPMQAAGAAKCERRNAFIARPLIAISPL